MLSTLPAESKVCFLCYALTRVFWAPSRRYVRYRRTRVCSRFSCALNLVEPFTHQTDLWCHRQNPGGNDYQKLQDAMYSHPNASRCCPMLLFKKHIFANRLSGSRETPNELTKGKGRFITRARRMQICFEHDHLSQYCNSLLDETFSFVLSI